MPASMFRTAKCFKMIELSTIKGLLVKRWTGLVLGCMVTGTILVFLDVRLRISLWKFSLFANAMDLFLRIADIARGFAVVSVE